MIGVIDTTGTLCTALKSPIVSRSHHTRTANVKMRGLLLIASAVATFAAASLAYDSQIAFEAIRSEPVTSAFDDIRDNATYWVRNGQNFIHRDGSTCEPSIFSCYDLIGELTYLSDEVVTHPAFDNHRLRIAEPKICDPDVKQYSGYLDISDGKHLFFWQVSLKSGSQNIVRNITCRFFESRRSPETSDFVYWTNGTR